MHSSWGTRPQYFCQWCGSRLVCFFWPPRSGSVIISRCQQDRKSYKTLISSILWLLYDFLSLETDENSSSKRTRKKTNFCWHPESSSQQYRSADPDPYQNVRDSQHRISKQQEGTDKSYPGIGWSIDDCDDRRSSRQTCSGVPASECTRCTCCTQVRLKGQ